MRKRPWPICDLGKAGFDAFQHSSVNLKLLLDLLTGIDFNAFDPQTVIDYNPDLYSGFVTIDKSWIYTGPMAVTGD
jgi:hypothetical protein